MYVSLQQLTIENVYAMFCRQFIVCFLLEMATRLFLWGLLLHMAMAQVAVQHQAHWDQQHNYPKYHNFIEHNNNSRWNMFAHSYNCFHNNSKTRIYDQCSYGSVSAGREKWPFNVLFSFFKVEPPCDQTWWDSLVFSILSCVSYVVHAESLQNMPKTADWG